MFSIRIIAMSYYLIVWVWLALTPGYRNSAEHRKQDIAHKKNLAAHQFYNSKLT